MGAAEPRKASLTNLDDGLTLTDGVMSVRGDFARMAKRAAARNLPRELLVRAAKVKGIDAPTAVDATAGLGEDSFLLAAAGFQVTMFERNPDIAALLEDAMARAERNPELAGVIGRMRLVKADALEGLPSLGFFPDVVYLDPMFPAKRKDSSAKKKLQLLQLVEDPCGDERELLDAAIAARPRKVVVKRPVKGPPLAGAKPSYSLAGKAIRYDCYAVGRP